MVISIRTYTAKVIACNFTVADYHTYYVGDTSVLVHNSGEGCDVPSECPSVPDRRNPNGDPVPYPDDVGPIVPKDQRPVRGKYRYYFIREWYDRGYSHPDKAWKDLEIHYILPNERGDGNEFENLTPLTRNEHQLFSN